METSFESELLQFLSNSVTPHQVVAQVSELLSIQGFVEVDLAETLPANPGPYFGSTGGTIFAWILPEKFTHFSIVGSHSDSPGFKIRPNPDRKSAYAHQLAVEIYGSPLWNSWLDRDLGIAGAVLIQSSQGPTKRLVNIAEPVAKIPQLAVHLDRGVNTSGLKLDPKRDLDPLLFTEANAFEDLLSSHLGVSTDSILSWDLMPYDLCPPATVGQGKKKLLSSARIDNLVSVFASLSSLRELTSSANSLPLMAVYDHEEVGSGTREGATSALTERILRAIAKSRDVDYEVVSRKSTLLSVDCAHATHPAHADKHEPNHFVSVNGGVVIKRNANQAYSTNLESELQVLGALLHEYQFQDYSHPNHLRCGTTIGPILSQTLGIPSVDIGVPQLAMHSVRETAGLADIAELSDLITSYWSL